MRYSLWSILKMSVNVGKIDNNRPRQACLKKIATCNRCNHYLVCTQEDCFGQMHPHKNTDGIVHKKYCAENHFSAQHGQLFIKK